MYVRASVLHLPQCVRARCSFRARNAHAARTRGYPHGPLRAGERTAEVMGNSAALGLRRYTARARPMRTLSNGGCRSHLKGPPKRMRRYNAYNSRGG